MENKLILGLMVVLGLSLLANALLIVELKHERQGAGEDMDEGLKATGFFAKEDELALLREDVVEIRADELNKCCSFINGQGEQDSCYVIKDYDCRYCEEYCG